MVSFSYLHRTKDYEVGLWTGTICSFLTEGWLPVERHKGRLQRGNGDCVSYTEPIATATSTKWGHSLLSRDQSNQGISPQFVLHLQSQRGG